MYRPTVAELKKKYKNDNFFLTSFFKEKAVAIEESKINKRTIASLRRKHLIIPQKGYYYILKRIANAS